MIYIHFTIPLHTKHMIYIHFAIQLHTILYNPFGISFKARGQVYH